VKESVKALVSQHVVERFHDDASVAPKRNEASYTGVDQPSSAGQVGQGRASIFSNYFNIYNSNKRNDALAWLHESIGDNRSTQELPFLDGHNLATMPYNIEQDAHGQTPARQGIDGKLNALPVENGMNSTSNYTVNTQSDYDPFGVKKNLSNARQRQLINKLNNFNPISDLGLDLDDDRKTSLHMLTQMNNSADTRRLSIAAIGDGHTQQYQQQQTQAVIPIFRSWSMDRINLHGNSQSLISDSVAAALTTYSDVNSQFFHPQIPPENTNLSATSTENREEIPRAFIHTKVRGKKSSK
jgi:hypothetical protein